MRVSPLFLFLPLVAAACIPTTEEMKANLAPRASFDLHCPGDQLTMTSLGTNPSGMVTTFGVEGCGKRATYVRIPNTQTWTLNASQDHASK